MSQLPDIVQAALDDVQADLGEPDLDQPDLVDEVLRHLRDAGLDPISQAMIERPKILAWCVDRALRTEPALFRRVPPLAEKPPRSTRRGPRS